MPPHLDVGRNNRFVWRGPEHLLVGDTSVTNGTKGICELPCRQLRPVSWMVQAPFDVLVGQAVVLKLSPRGGAQLEPLLSCDE